MKLLQEFRSEKNNITHKLYELDSGVRFLHLVNPATVDTDFAIIVKAGAMYEEELDVPRGTAHFLEHMLLNPNSTFPTLEDIIKFEQGNKSKPGLQVNAHTDSKNITFTGHCNEEGLERLLERIESEFKFSLEMIEKQIEKERGIILAEKSRDLKRGDDEYMCFMEFLFKDKYPELTTDLIGEVSDIRKITAEDLEKHFQERFTKENTVIALQSGKDISKTTEKKITEISELFKAGERKDFREIDIPATYEVGAFQDKRANGITITLDYLLPQKEKIDYKDWAYQIIIKSLFYKLTFDILREKKSLIYGLRTWSYRQYFYGYSNLSFELTTEKEKVEEMLEEFDEIIHDEAFEFLDSEQGKDWYEDGMSQHLYPRTQRFQNRLADHLALPLLEDSEVFNDNKYKEVFEEITLDDIKKYYKKFIQIPPRIWIKSDMNKNEMLEIIKDSPFEGRYGKNKN